MMERKSILICSMIIATAVFAIIISVGASASGNGEWVLNDDLLRRVMYIEASSAQDLASKLAAYEPQMATTSDASGKIIRKDMADILKYGRKSIFVSDVVSMGSDSKGVMKDIVDYYKSEGYKLVKEDALGRTQVEVEGAELQKGDINRIFITKGNYLIEYRTQESVFSAEFTPVKTFNWKLVWIILAIAVVIAGFIFLKKKGILRMPMIKMLKLPKTMPRIARRKERAIAKKEKIKVSEKFGGDKLAGWINIFIGGIILLLFIVLFAKSASRSLTQWIFALFVFVIPSLILLFCGYNCLKRSKRRFCMIFDIVAGIIFLFLGFYSLGFMRVASAGNARFNINTIIPYLFILFSIALFYSVFRLKKKK